MCAWAPYMRWAKTRPAARFDLASSNLHAVTPDEWPAAAAPLPLTADNGDGYPPLVEAIAATAGVSSDAVATATGASGANFLAIAAMVRPGDEVLVETPGYDPLAGAARLIGADVRRVERCPAEGWLVDPDRVAAALAPRTRLLVLTNPHNPTGAPIDRARLAALAALADRAGFHVLVDEVYLDTMDEADVVSAAAVSDRFIVTSSLTKAYGLAGLRCGWAIAAPAVAARIREVRDVVDGVGAVPAEALAVRAFADLAALRTRARALVARNRTHLEAFFAERPDVEWQPPRGGTVTFPALLTVGDTQAFAERLHRDHGTAVVPGAFFDAPAHIRVSYGMDTTILEGGLAALGAALAAPGA